MPQFDFPPQLNELRKKQLDSGAYASEDSEDEVLIAALHTLEASSDDTAVREALDSLDAGEQGVTLQEAIDEVRRRNNVGSNA
jgi:hypothetical protein